MLSSSNSSRRIVKDAIEFNYPSRLAVCIRISPQFMEEVTPDSFFGLKEMQKKFPPDILILDLPTGWDFRFTRNVSIRDGWGTLWQQGRAIETPLENWDKLSNYHFPNPDEGFEEAKRRMQSEGEEKYILGRVWFTLFERLFLLRGFCNCLTDTYYHQDEFLYLRDKIVEFDKKVIKNWIQLQVDGIFFSDDWGTQSDLIISPQQWRALYKPCYQILFDLCRRAGIDVFFHSDGNVDTLIPDLIDCGMQVLNPVQPQAMNLQYLGRKYREKLCFWGGVDTQSVLPFGSPNQVKEHVKAVIKALGSKKGGYIGGTSHLVLPDVPLDNIKAVYAILYEQSFVDNI